MYPGGRGIDLARPVCGASRASSDHDEFLAGVPRQGTQGFLSPVFENQGNRFTEVRQTFFTRSALAVGAGHFGAVRDVPWSVPLDNGRKLVVHVLILPPPA